MHSPYARVRPYVCFNLKKLIGFSCTVALHSLTTTFFLRRCLIFVNIEYNNRNLDVKMYTHICAHFERRLLNINPYPANVENRVSS
jgi:hypothetical protein